MVKTSSELDGTGHANQHGLSRKASRVFMIVTTLIFHSDQHIFASVKQSLERLQLDYIDVLQCLSSIPYDAAQADSDHTGHRFDTETPIEETVNILYIHKSRNILFIRTQMHALHDIVKTGYVRYIGMSSCWAYQCMWSIFFGLRRLLTICSQYHAESASTLGSFTMLSLTIILDYATQNNLTPFISMQNHYSLVYREEEREMFPTLKGILLLPLQVANFSWSTCSSILVLALLHGLP